MSILRIEHPVPDFAGWKQAFDDDPLGRSRSGVRRHRVFRSFDDPNHVFIDLEFDTNDDAAALLDRLQTLWQRVQDQGVIGAPRAHILEEIESVQYGS